MYLPAPSRGPSSFARSLSQRPMTQAADQTFTLLETRESDLPCIKTAAQSKQIFHYEPKFLCLEVEMEPGFQFSGSRQFHEMIIIFILLITFIKQNYKLGTVSYFDTFINFLNWFLQIHVLKYL